MVDTISTWQLLQLQTKAEGHTFSWAYDHFDMRRRQQLWAFKKDNLAKPLFHCEIVPPDPPRPKGSLCPKIFWKHLFLRNTKNTPKYSADKFLDRNFETIWHFFLEKYPKKTANYFWGSKITPQVGKINIWIWGRRLPLIWSSSLNELLFSSSNKILDFVTSTFFWLLASSASPSYKCIYS